MAGDGDDVQDPPTQIVAAEVGRPVADAEGLLERPDRTVRDDRGVGEAAECLVAGDVVAVGVQVAHDQGDAGVAVVGKPPTKHSPDRPDQCALAAFGPGVQ